MLRLVKLSVLACVGIVAAWWIDGIIWNRKVQRAVSFWELNESVPYIDCGFKRYRVTTMEDAVIAAELLARGEAVRWHDFGSKEPQHEEGGLAGAARQRVPHFNTIMMRRRLDRAPLFA